jgi:hypothetical protein
VPKTISETVDSFRSEGIGEVETPGKSLAIKDLQEGKLQTSAKPTVDKHLRFKANADIVLASTRQ